MRTASITTSVKFALALATALVLAACATDAGRVAQVDGSNGNAVAIAGFR